VQKFWSLLFAVVIIAAVGLFAISPAMGWWLPRDVSSFGGDVDNLFYLILWITGFFFVLTEGLLIYSMYRFAGTPGKKAVYVHGNHKLEVLWTIVPAFILVLIGVLQMNTWANIKYQSRMPQPGRDTQQIEVVARQWEWRMRYPSPARLEAMRADPSAALSFASDPHIDDVHVANEVHVWRNEKGKKDPQKVLISLKTRDVLHSFKLVNLRLMQDAVPGKTIPVWFMVEEEYNTKFDEAAGKWRDGYDEKTGKWAEYDAKTGLWSQPDKIWELGCAEYCGTRHTAMKGKLFVHKNREDFVKWLIRAEQLQNQHTPTPTPATTTTAAR
jgi:cytochrome c oxidase subunit 2